jgi:hypothetical protein
MPHRIISAVKTVTSYQVKLLSYFSQIPSGNGQVLLLELLEVAVYAVCAHYAAHQAFQIDDDHRGEGDVITLGFTVGIAADDKQVSPFLKKLHIGRLQLFFQTNWQALHRGCPNLFGIPGPLYGYRYYYQRPEKNGKAGEGAGRPGALL